MLFSYAQEYSPLFFHKVPIMLENSPIMVTYNGELCLLQKHLSGWLINSLAIWVVGLSPGRVLCTKPMVQCLNLRNLSLTMNIWSHNYLIRMLTVMAMQEMMQYLNLRNLSLTMTSSFKWEENMWSHTCLPMFIIFCVNRMCTNLAMQEMIPDSCNYCCAL